MTAKQIKYFQALLDFARSDYTSNPEVYLDFLRFSVENDFTNGVHLWECLFVINEASLTDEDFARAYSVKSFEIIQSRSEQRAIKALVDSPVLSRAYYQYAVDPISDEAIKMLIDFVLCNKLAPADEGFKGLAKNQFQPHGTQMKAVVERLFVEVLKRVGGGKPAMTKKQITLLLNHISKIKGPEKALLTQRIRELT